MRFQKNSRGLFFILLTIMLLTTYCAKDQQAAVTSTDEGIVPSKTSSPTPWSTPTLKPTNQVPIQDSGIPLPPKVMDYSPGGGKEIGENGMIEVIFDQPMEPNTTSAAWSLLDPSGALVGGQVTWPEPDKMKFKPNSPLIPGSIYSAQISTQATSLENVNLLEVVSFDVHIASELLVSQVFPENGSKEIASNAVITVIFNRPVTPLISVEDQRVIPEPIQAAPEIEGHGEWISTSVFVFHPEEALISSTTYEIEVIEGLEDTVGSKLQEPFIWEFTTTAPSIASYGLTGPDTVINPEDNYEDVRPESALLINFQQPMNKDSVSNAFSLFDQGGDDVSVDYEWTTDHQVVISPTVGFALETSYTMLLTDDAMASSGGKLQDELRWDFSTIPYPTVDSTFPADGSQQSHFSSRFSIYFSSPINIETIEDHVIINPQPEGELSWYYHAWVWNVDFYGLKPSTDYSVVVLPGIEDIYGNQTADEYSFTFRTADLRSAAYIDLPYAPSIYTLGGSMRFFVSYVNVSTVESALYRLPLEYFVGFDNGTYNRWEFIPPSEWQVNHWFWENSKGVNEITRRGVGLTDSNGESLLPGFYLLTINSPQVSSGGEYLDTRLLIIAEANLTLKTTPSEGLIWLTDLTSGEPIEGVSLEIFNEDFDLVGTGATNSQGLLYLDLPLEEELYKSRYFKTILNAPFAFAISNWGSGVSPYDFGIWSSYYSLPNQPVAYVYTDRPLYRPGQVVNFKGIIRQNDDLYYQLLTWETVNVEITSFNEGVFNETLPVSDFGTFDGILELDEDAALGYYSISVSSTSGDERIGGVGFTVAEYRKPEFQVSNNASSDEVLAGEEFSVLINAEYYSGGGVGNADVVWAIEANDFTFQPIGDLRRYNFVDFDRDSGYQYDFYESSSREIIADGEDLTDSSGNLTIPLVAELGDSGNSRKFTFEATITDVAGTSVSDRVEIIAHQAEFYPGVRSKKYVGSVGEEQAFDLVVVDWESRPVADIGVDIEIVERRWYSVQEQDSQGYTQWTTTVEEIPVTSLSDVKMDSRGRGSVNFTPIDGGVYKAKVSVQDSYGNVAKTAAYIWITSSDYISWRQTDDRRITLVADKETYQPGDVAEILITSPFYGSNYALISVERGHIQQYDVIRLASNSVVYRLPITAEMAPNIYFSTLIIQGAEDDKPDFRIGMVELNVLPKVQEVSVEIIADQEQSSPGEEVTYNVRTTNNAGDPIRAEVSLALVDLSSLALIGPNSIPIMEYFYSNRSLGVKTTVPIVFNIEHYLSTLEDRLTEGAGMGSGGGKGADISGVLDIRGDFKDTAFWKANVVTDENGAASVTVELPDNLTIWRMEVRAVTMDTKVGDSELDLRSTKPLLVRPQTPRFFVNGDQSRIGAAVHNNTDEDLSVNVSLVASGLSINSPQLQNVELGAGEQAFITWEVGVSATSERVDLVIMANGGDYSDASRPTMGTLDNGGIPVYKYEVPETVGTSGVLTESGSRTEGIQIPSSWNVTQGNIQVNISPSLVAGMTEGLEYLEHYPYECIEQTVSRFLPNVLTHQALNQAGRNDPELERGLREQINLAAQRLYNWQRPDGGWGWWPEASESDPLTSAYVVMGLVEAKNAGYHINADTLDRGIRYLKGRLVSPGSFEKQYLLNRQAFVLYVLARAGEPQFSLTSVMYDHRQALSIYAEAFLAETLWRIDPGDPRLDTLISDFISSATVSATGVHWNEEWRDYWNWNSDTRTTAIVLSTMLLIDPDNQLNPNAVRWLMSNQTEGHWQSTQETSWSLITLARWLVISDELKADYEWAVGINNERLGDGSANQDNLTETTVLVEEVSSLVMDGINRLTIARDTGGGNLYYTAHLNVYLPVDQLDPLDRGIIISREYYNPTLSPNPEPVLSARQGDLLLARLTVVVPEDIHFVVIDDPLPAGLEAIDPSFETSPDITAPERLDFEGIWQEGWGWWYFDYVEFRDEKVVISADYLPAGTYVYTYMVRASTPGTYYSLPPTAQEFYFPEVYGRGAGSQFVVKP